MTKCEYVKIKDVCSIEKGTTGLAKATPGEFPLVTTGADRKTTNSYQFDTAAVCIPLVSSTGHGKKSLNYVHYQVGKFALGTILAAVVPKDKKVLDARYLHAYLQKNKDRVLVRLMKGAANVSLSMKDIANVEIPLPSLATQKDILEKIDNIVDEQGELIAESISQEGLLNKLRQAILQEAIEGKLTAEWRKQNPELISGDEHASRLLEKIKIVKEGLIKSKKIRKEKSLKPITEREKPFDMPNGWAWSRLGDICSKIGSGSTPKGGNYSVEGFPFFRSQNVYDEGLVYEDIKYISKDIHKKMKGTVVYPGDVLLNITGGSLGRCALVTDDCEEGNVSQHVCIIRGIEVNEQYLHILMRSPAAQRMMFENTTGAGREGLPKYNLEQFLIPLPPKKEQLAIVKKVEKAGRMVAELERQVAKRKNQSEMLMQTVLREAFDCKDAVNV